MTAHTFKEQVAVDVGPVLLDGDLEIPDGAGSILLFAHGSGSGRHSPRSKHVARRFHEAGMATLLVDLLTSEEDQLDRVTARLRFDIDLLADRLVGAIDWLAGNPRTSSLAVGLIGSSTGGGAALVAATRRPERVDAVVSRGGRPDLAGDALWAVRVPTMLIVGGNDEVILDLNEHAFERIGTPTKKLVIVAGATHLFEEPGALDQVARLASDWFVKHLAACLEEAVW